MDLELAVEVFAKGFCQVKSRFGPYIPRHDDGVWILEDHRKKPYPRRPQLITAGNSPEHILKVYRQNSIGQCFVCTVFPSDKEALAARPFFKVFGFRPTGLEWIFVNDLKNLEPAHSDPMPVKIESAKQLAEVRQWANQPRKFHPGSGLWGVWNEERDFGWIEDVKVEKYSYCHGFGVEENMRRKGYGRALMNQYLADCRDNGDVASVIVASTMGAFLYEAIGCTKLGTLSCFYTKPEWIPAL